MDQNGADAIPTLTDRSTTSTNSVHMSASPSSMGGTKHSCIAVDPSNVEVEVST